MDMFDALKSDGKARISQEILLQRLRVLSLAL